jgi:phosphoglycolate phosphatase
MAQTYEDDFRPRADEVATTRFIPGTAIEIVQRGQTASLQGPAGTDSQSPNSRRLVSVPAGRSALSPPRFALFDFDGTLSLIREGWQSIMIPMMVELLQETGSGEPAAALTETVRNFVAELTGKQTIYQMMRLDEEIRKRGGRPREPLEYKKLYLDRLMVRIHGRREALRGGQAAPETMLVPGSVALLRELQERGVQMFLTSGTDERYVVEEARLLKLEKFFGRHIYGALEDPALFSKQMVIERILKENRVAGASLLGFGDGFVEIEEIKRVGGVAVAVASDEVNRRGVNAWKRQRLIQAGADIVIPEYRHHERLLQYLFAET